ncbi:MAG: acetylornithine deacetylase [Paraburkholderia sp.]|jgi:acetylornithine deacetylase|uniref:acetylornithine deacetylase n=1 Tax=Paraburkholderia sp. TaxID=1926495 RepID=UPI002AFE9808|nr:acetylornithine deacetylase [Paraburkholderia sp.]MEA3085854.1 acetylornithine deacetylase [Paraburkholderia sp.]
MNVRSDSNPLSTAVEWVSRLVEIETVSRNSNLGLIETVQDFLAGVGLKTHLTYDARKTKANLFATIPAADGRVEGGILFSGHTDVVPVDGQDWHTEPFRAVIKDDRLYGRGSADMKGYLGVLLSLVPELTDAHLAEPVHLAFSFDEEVGCLGVPLLLADMRERGLRPTGCIVGEPTSMRPVIAHKGLNHYRCCVVGRSVHSSLTPSGVNAIEYAARIICFIRDMADEFRRTGPFDKDFDVPYTTAQTGLVRGGVALNTVPNECQFDFELRDLPGTDVRHLVRLIETYGADLEAQMKAVFDGASVTFSCLGAAPSLSEVESSAIVQLARALTHDSVRRKVAYGTEAGYFSSAGVPTVVCGPGNIEQAHRPNEFVELAQLQKCEAFLRSATLLSVQDGVGA